MTVQDWQIYCFNKGKKEEESESIYPIVNSEF